MSADPPETVVVIVPLERRAAEIPVTADRRKQSGGRKKLWDGTISFRLTKSLHESLAREALRRDIPLSDVIRERLSARPFRISKPNPDPLGT